MIVAISLVGMGRVCLGTDGSLYVPMCLHADEILWVLMTSIPSHLLMHLSMRYSHSHSFSFLVCLMHLFLYSSC